MLARANQAAFTFSVWPWWWCSEIEASSCTAGATDGELMGSTAVATTAEAVSFTPVTCNTFIISSNECHPIPIAPPMRSVDTARDPTVSYLPVENEMAT